MATAFDTPVLPFAEPFSDLPSQWLEASTRAFSASAELYTQVLNTQAETTRALFAAYRGFGTGAVETGSERAAETTARAAETAARTTRSTARTTSRTAKRTTRRAASTTRRAAKPAARATKPATPAAKPAARAAKPGTPAAKPATPAAKPAGPAAKPAGRAAPKPATPAPATPAAPISGYDDLTAEQVLVQLADLPQTALREIAAYEQAHQKRATVLQRVATLSGPEPAPGYDGLSTEDAEKLVTDGSPELAATVRDYERRHKNRTSVVQAAVRRTDAGTPAS
jgi:hypothetical protein